MLLCDVACSQTDLERLLVEENFILLVCSKKVCLLKLQNADHERDATNQIPHVLNRRHIQRISRRSHRWFAVRGILYKGAIAHNPWCSRCQRIEEADISTPVAVNQRAAICPEETVRSFTAMGLSEGRFDLSTFRSERTNEASTLTITPKRSSSRDVGTSSYRYHTATYPPASVSANR
ncbi:hypothetical protein TNCV_4675231 [Trichonephila clavipes]|nr:hypothetical protein TNCV_4675231 [Trichonephila clavipes]